MSEHAPEGLACLVIDMQPSLLAAISDKEELLKRVKMSIRAAALFGIPIAFTEQNPSKLGGTDPELLGLAGEAEVFSKQSFSAFGAEGLSAWIEKNDIQHLIICGIETPVCIYQTALGADDEGLSVTLLLDAIGERRPADRNAVLNSIAGPHCHILPAETVFYSLLQSAEHPLFREFNQIIKES